MIPKSTTFNYIPKAVTELPNPLEEHLGTSRWQTCNCETCQTKRMTLDAMPGEKIDWEKFKKSAE